jgi:Family of unknown function (DUF5706)
MVGEMADPRRTDGPPILTDEAEELTRRLLVETREELTKADTKAQILLAASAVVVGVVLGGAIGGKWTPTVLVAVAEVLWWIGVLGTALGIASLGFALYPRLLQSHGSRITYFEDVRRFDDAAAVRAALNEEARRGDRDVQQLLRLGRVVHTKYRSIQWAIVALAVGAVLCGGSALFG